MTSDERPLQPMHSNQVGQEHPQGKHPKESGQRLELKAGRQWTMNQPDGEDQRSDTAQDHRRRRPALDPRHARGAKAVHDQGLAQQTDHKPSRLEERLRA